ncbi:hypothetical protein PAXRUDRAFT_78380, partial [Paxillus rubicundulus Ve08.2h10]
NLFEAHKCAHTVPALTIELGVPDLPNHLRRFLFDQLNTDDRISSEDVHLPDCPMFTRSLKIFNSATAIFVSPSDLSGIGRMWQEKNHATPSWHCGPGCYDCVFVATSNAFEGMLGMEIA